MNKFFCAIIISMINYVKRMTLNDQISAIEWRIKMYPDGDFHVHTQFCPHGADDLMEQYVVTAIERGLTHLSFTEHAPLPTGFEDPVPAKDSAMCKEDLSAYFAEGARLKEKYKDKISIHIGFEVDYIVGYEKETEAFLNEFGKKMDDAILSVHMLQAPNDEYVCVDYSLEEFKRIIKLFGSVEAVYQAYYDTVIQSLHASLGKYKPTRIGHITLIEKFSKSIKPEISFRNKIYEILKLVKQKNYSLDANTAGFFKKDCGSSYPPPAWMKIANENKIPLVYGSDSHRAADIGVGFDLLPKNITFSFPSHNE